MNPKVQFKLIRNIHFTVFKDYSVTLQIDSTNLIGKSFGDIDIDSIFMSIELIKKGMDLHRFIDFIVKKLCPSIMIKRSCKMDQIKRFISFDNPDTLLINVLKNNLFDRLSYAIGILIYNHYYYAKYRKFLVFYDSYQKELTESANNRIDFKKIISKIVDSNEDFYTINSFKTLSEISKAISEIPYHELKTLEIKKVFIHGSFAKNNQNEFSDIDILVESDLKIDYKDLYILTRLLFSHYLGEKLDVVINNSKDIVTGFLKNAYKTSVLIRDTLIES